MFDMPNFTDLKVGDSVQFDINKIKSHPDYESLVDDYKAWIEANKFKVMKIKSIYMNTVELEGENKWTIDAFNLTKYDPFENEPVF